MSILKKLHSWQFRVIAACISILISSVICNFGHGPPIGNGPPICHGPPMGVRARICPRIIHLPWTYSFGGKKIQSSLATLPLFFWKKVNLLLGYEPWTFSLSTSSITTTLSFIYEVEPFSNQIYCCASVSCFFHEHFYHDILSVPNVDYT